MGIHVIKGRGRFFGVQSHRKLEGGGLGVSFSRPWLTLTYREAESRGQLSNAGSPGKMCMWQCSAVVKGTSTLMSSLLVDLTNEWSNKKNVMFRPILFISVCISRRRKSTSHFANLWLQNTAEQFEIWEQVHHTWATSNSSTPFQ